MNDEQQTLKEALPVGLDGSFLDALTEQLEAGANARAIYGDPIEREGITLIPVARARWGVGGGTGAQPNARATGTGAGGGVMVAPAGFIEICEGHATFKPIRSPALTLAAVVGGFALVMTALKTVQLAIESQNRRRRFRFGRR